MTQEIKLKVNDRNHIFFNLILIFGFENVFRNEKVRKLNLFFVYSNNFYSDMNAGFVIVIFNHLKH